MIALRAMAYLTRHCRKAQVRSETRGPQLRWVDIRARNLHLIAIPDSEARVVDGDQNQGPDESRILGCNRGHCAALGHVRSL